MTEFEKVAEVSIRHAYFEGVSAPVRLTPMGQHPNLKMHMRQGFLEIFAPKGRTLSQPDTLLFKLEPLDEIFYAASVVTPVRDESALLVSVRQSGRLIARCSDVLKHADLITKLVPDGTMTPDALSGKVALTPAQLQARKLEMELRLAFGVLELTLAQEEKPIEAEIVFQAVSAHWAYLVAGNQLGQTLSVRTNGDAVFEPKGAKTLPNGDVVEVFESRAPIALSSRPKYQFALLQTDAHEQSKEVIPRLPQASCEGLTKASDDGRLVASVHVNLY